jgi:hypothetical protein
MTDPKTMTDAELLERVDLLDKEATEGPWVHDEDEEWLVSTPTDDEATHTIVLEGRFNEGEDRWFTEEARTLVPELARRLRTAQDDAFEAAARMCESLILDGEKNLSLAMAANAIRALKTTRDSGEEE